MRFSGRFICFAVFVGLVLHGVPAGAQGSTSGLIRGTVTDPQGGVLPGVTVIAKSDAVIGGQKIAITNAEGNYRFPALNPGLYSLEAQLSGFQSVLQENVVVQLGSSIDVNLQMGDVTISGEIVVVAESTQVSTVSNSVSHNLGESFIERQPLVRDPVNLMNYAPGVQGDQAYGAPSSYQNAYNLDGVDVSDPELGSQWVLPSMDWIQEVEVGGLGADAEFGGFTGAVVNLITKSGGNQFHGDVIGYYSGGNLNSSNAPEGVEGTNKVDKDIEGSVNVGGPLVRDTMWFFASIDDRQRVVDPFFADGAPTDDMANSDRTELRGLAKVTWQINAGNKVLGLVDYDGVDHDYRGVGDYTLASGTGRQDSPNFSYNLTWESLLNDSNFVSAKFTGYTGTDDRLPYFGDTPNHYDSWEGWDWANQTSTSSKEVGRNAVNASWNLFADGLITKNDSHDFKFGLVYETMKSDYTTTRNGGFSYYDDSYYCDSSDAYFADPLCGVYSSDWGGEWNLRAKMDGFNFYAQDSWKTGRITVNYGVRYTKYTGDFRDPVSAPTSGGSHVYDVNMWAPRLGLVWDVTGNGTTAIKLHYGIYYDGMSVVLYDREASGDALSDTLYYDYNFDTGEFDIPAGESVNAYADMNPNINHPNVEQFVVTVEHQLMDELMIGLDYIHRTNKDIVAMVTSNVEDYDPQVAPDNPFGGGPLPFFDLLDPPQFYITNPSDAVRDYDSVALRMHKRYTGKWSLDASLVWSDLTGNADWGLNGYIDNFEDLNGLVNADGTLPFNSEWVFKVAGSVDLPLNFMLSGFYQYQTGAYWTPYVRMQDLYYNDRTTVFLTPRGSEQYEDRGVLDLHLEYDFDLGRNMELALMVDAFNVLDSDTVTSVSQRWGDYYYDYRDHPEGSEWVGTSSFETPTSIQTPRVIRFGVRFGF